MPANGSVGTITVSPRFLSQVRDVLEREQFDLLHFHEPFVPFLSLVVLGLSNSVNVATFHAFGGFSPAYQIGSRLMRPSIGRIHGRIAVSAAARHFIDRFFPGDYKVIPNGVDVGRFERAVPIAKWQDGTKNILFVGRFESRKGLLDLLKAYRILRKTGCHCRLLVVGGGPQEQGGAALPHDPQARRRRVPRARQRRRARRAVQDRRRLLLAGHRPRIVRDRAARGDGRRHGDRRAATSTATRASSGAAARASSCRRASRRRSPARWRSCSSTTSSARRWAASGLERAQEFSWERVTAKVEDYYGFVIRRLAAQGELPEGFHAEVPPSPRGPRRSPLEAPSTVARRRAGGRARA